MWWKQFFIVNFLIISIVAGGPKKIRFELKEEEKVEVKPHADPIDGIEYRLPNNTIPLHYDIFLSTEVHVPFFAFDGIVTIRLKALENTTDITVHFRQLVILNVDLLDANGMTIQTNVNFQQNDVKEFLIIHPQNSLIMDEIYHVRISYLGTLRDDDAGFYRGSYVDNNGVRKWHATTQFESTDARHAFPCYDEPQIRTSFSIKIRHHSSYTAIANTPQISQVNDENSNGFVITTFAEIPSVQTYLLAFVVSDFNYVENATVVPSQRVFAKPSSIANGDANYALEVSPTIMKALEDYTGINYTFAKMDQIALPNFAAGAMENWGLVTYREIYLLYNTMISTTRNKENILLTIAHEFVHQWFGNLVCPEWWSWLWLNEGFATLYEYMITNIVYPDERWNDAFIMDVLQAVMETDSNPTRRAMTHYVENPVLIDRLFDSVAYSKSGSVLHTFMHAFGAPTWQKGLNYYLNNRFNNFANSDHLYEALQWALNEDYPTSTPNVSAIMRSWEYQAGFPLITVTRNDTHVTISQERFLYGDDESSSLWYVPLNYYTGINKDTSNTRPLMWMNPMKEMSIARNSLPLSWSESEWAIFNTKQSYYYRVNYDKNLWELIIEQINGDTYDDIHLLNRAQLINDAFHLARAHKIDYDILFGLMNYLSKETDYVPWLAANRAHTLLNRWLSGSKIYADYLAWLRNNVAALYNRLGAEIIEGEQRLDRYARTIAINLGCQTQLPKCLRETNQELLAFIHKGKRIAPEYVSTIYCNGMRTANGVLYETMKDWLLRSLSQTDRNNIITAIGCMQDKNLLHEFFNFAITPTTLAPLTLDERIRIFTAPLPNGDHALDTLLNFTENNLNYIHALGGTVFNSILLNIATRVGSQKTYDRFVEVMQMILDYGGINMSDFESYKTSAMGNLNWQRENIGAIENFFGYSETTTVTTSTLDTTTQGSGSIVMSTVVLFSCLIIKGIF